MSPVVEVVVLLASLSSFLQRGRGGSACKCFSNTLGHGVLLAAGEKSSSSVWSPSWKSIESMKCIVLGEAVRIRRMSLWSCRYACVVSSTR